MTRPTLKRMAVAAILATTTTTTASIYDDRNIEPHDLVSSDINQNDKPQQIDEQHSIIAADNRKRKQRQQLSIRRIDEEISTLSNTVPESASPLQPQSTQPQTLIGQSYKIPPPRSNNEKVVVKGTVSTNDERMLGKIGNRAGLLAKRRNNNNNSSGNNSNKNRTVGNGKKAGSNQNRNQGGTQSSGSNTNKNNNKNGNRNNPNKKQRSQLPGQVRPGQVRPGRQKKPGFRNRGGKLGGGRRGPRLFHDTSTHRWGSSGDTRWSGGTRWYSKSSKSKGGKKWGSSWSIDDCSWDTSWDLPSWPKPGDWERSYSIDWHPPSWGDDDWNDDWNDDWKPGWKPKPPSWSGGWEWVDDWNGGGNNWGGGGWWGKIEEESLFPTESPELFPTLSPTLAPTLSPTLEP